MVVREKLADYSHAAWAGWMDYLFSKCGGDTAGGKIIPQEFVERWQRQARTPYSELPESEKASDRDEADKMLEIIQEDTP